MLPTIKKYELREITKRYFDRTIEPGAVQVAETSLPDGTIGNIYTRFRMDGTGNDYFITKSKAYACTAGKDIARIVSEYRIAKGLFVPELWEHKIRMIPVCWFGHIGITLNSASLGKLLGHDVEICGARKRWYIRVDDIVIPCTDENLLETHRKLEKDIQKQFGNPCESLPDLAFWQNLSGERAVEYFDRLTEDRIEKWAGRKSSPEIDAESLQWEEVAKIAFDIWTPEDYAISYEYKLRLAHKKALQLNIPLSRFKFKPAKGFRLDIIDPS
jgi:hypothetical protein